MSCRNIFVFQFKYKPSCVELKSLQNQLKQIAIDAKIGIHFDIKDYYDEMNMLLKLENNYFFISESDEILECESLFDLGDAYEFAKQFNRKFYDQKLNEYLTRKFWYFNEFIKVLFGFPFLEQIDFYISDQYSLMLEDFKLKEVKEKKLLDAFLLSLQPQKEEKYFGLKTCKFIVCK